MLIAAITFISVASASESIISAPGKPRIIFLHHSVGESLIRDGSVRHILTEAGFDFWDHGYNNHAHGLRNEKGEPAGCYWIPDDNTDPDGIANLFLLNPAEDNTFGKIISKYDVIIFKSCFPANRIGEDNIEKDTLDHKRKSLYNYKRHYLSIRDTTDKHPEKIFIIVTQPPLHPNATTIDEAGRAKAFVEWLKSKEYLADRKNLFVFDYFSFLTDPRTNMLRAEYQLAPVKDNSHPNPIAQMRIGPLFADFIINVVKHRSVNSDLPRVIFDSSPTGLVRVSSPVITLTGKVIASSDGLHKISWTDLKGHAGSLPPCNSWSIHDMSILPGTTKIIVTAIDTTGLRSSAAIGLQYYSGKAKEAVIFDGALKNGVLDDISYAEMNQSAGGKELIITGTGGHKRVAVKEINLDISDFDPETTSLEINYDQGTDGDEPELSIIGIGSFPLKADKTIGYEKFSLPFNKFIYVQNTLDKIVLRGKWGKGTQVKISSIKLISSGKKLQ